MFELALKARVPIIQATTADLMNLQEVLEFYAQSKVGEVKNAFPIGFEIYYAVADYEPSRTIYDKLAEDGKTLILINQGEDSPYAFRAGEIPVPAELMTKALEGIVSVKNIGAVVQACRGLTLKTMAEVIRITSSTYGSVTAQEVRSVRAMMTGTQVGLDQVDTSLGVYRCPEWLEEWVKINGKYFINTQVDPRLVPRGLLFAGPPGVGKTMGAKYIANQFKVHLYRLDMASALGRYVGQSEANLSKVINTIDREEPCVLLMDEVEKLFAESDDTGVTARLLSQLLWWLQEHKSRVLTVMTTNNLEGLPPELYRPGRIDMVAPMKMIGRDEALSLGMEVFSSFKGIESNKSSFKGLLTKYLNSSRVGPRVGLSHAEVVEEVYTIIKQQGWLL